MKPNQYVIVRTYSMGVFAGELVSHEPEIHKVVLKNARRIWSWAGAASLSQLATDGTSKPKECKFPKEVTSVVLTSPNGFEILEVSDRARESISGVKVWEE
jgi:hypothetical protein